MSNLHILHCIKTSKGFKSGNIWMDKLFSHNEGSDCLPFFFAPLENFSIIWSYLWRAAKFDLYSGTHGHWSVKVFSVPHLLWHSIGLYFHLRGSVTLTTLTERLALELSLPVLRLVSVAAGIRKPNLPHARSPL